MQINHILLYRFKPGIERIEEHLDAMGRFLDATRSGFCPTRRCFTASLRKKAELRSSSLTRWLHGLAPSPFTKPSVFSPARCFLRFSFQSLC